MLYNYSKDISYTDIERSTKINGYNIFEKTVSEDIEYTFCFNMPYDYYFKQYVDDPEETATLTVGGVWPAYNEFTFETYDIYKASIQSE